MTNALEYKIIQIRLKDLLFRKCPLENPVMNFTFDMTVLNLFENVVETISVYDKVAEDFIGISPKELTEYLDKDESLLTKLEEIGKGLYISAETIPLVKAFSTRKAKKITINSDCDLKLLQLLNKQT
ncbi:hypothetical protein HPULCUR_002475 [Helicostylum pulchrum]|uniref:Uncharacterized protein n=1 Tax=Helicostylum pulchrum TaxID=562976 RepID=A0ABP9XQT9_9FUNG